MDSSKADVAYFSMEIGFHPDVPTYAGGLGVLAGDTIRSAADSHLPMVAVTLLHRHGYFFQRISNDGWQSEEPVKWVVNDFVQPTEGKTSLELEGRIIQLRSWKFDVKGVDGFCVPVILLDADVPENSEWDRHLTDCLYGGDRRYRLCQEAILGIGGVRMLRQLGYDEIQRFHMNEGHSALLTLELLQERLNNSESLHNDDDLDAVRRQCVFTTHTPVPSGHDQFDLDMVSRVLGSKTTSHLSSKLCHEGRLNMTYLALAMSHYINGVAKRHGDISQHMFAGYKIDSITNGVHAATWVSDSFAALFDHHIASWKQDNFSLRAALSIPDDNVWLAHRSAKHRLIEYVNRETNSGFDIDYLTIGFARRAATYKRGELVFQDLERLKKLSRERGMIQLVFAGKAHPQDEQGKTIIQHIIQTGRALSPDVNVTYLANYDVELARIMTSGVDLWLNTPEPPLEASGTSGMKAALNGVPSLSILDGWWIEGCIEGLTGWAIGADANGSAPEASSEAASDALYMKLEKEVLPKFYSDRSAWVAIMRHTIALNGAFFNTQRMLQQYVLKAYYE